MKRPMTQTMPNYTKSHTDQTVTIATVRRYSDAINAVEEIDAAGIPLDTIVIEAHNVRMTPKSAWTRNLSKNAALATVWAVTLSLLNLLVLATMGWLDPLISLSAVMATVLAINVVLALSAVLFFHLSKCNVPMHLAEADVTAETYELKTDNPTLADNARRLLR